MGQAPERDITLSIFPTAGVEDFIHFMLGIGDMEISNNNPTRNLINRIQHVHYHTNDLEGYVAEVTYEGHHGAIGGHGGPGGIGGHGHGGIGGHGGHGGHP